jgi:hypothetical protein
VHAETCQILPTGCRYDPFCHCAAWATILLDTDPTVIGNLAGELGRYLATGIDGFFIDQPILGVQIREATRAGN